MNEGLRPTSAVRKVFNLLKRMAWAGAGFSAIALVSWAALVFMVYDIDCASGNDSSVFEVPSKFSVELHCPKATLEKV